MSSRIWIVGGSSGIGLELVKLWVKEGSRVIVSARNASRNDYLLRLKHEFPDTLHLLDMDVTHERSVSDAVSSAWNVFNGIDLWFYNAGAYETMKVDDLDINHIEQMTQVNYLGAVRVMNELLPYFNKQNSGRWVFNLSLSSYFGLPYGGGYSAPKAALLNLAESLQPELLEKDIQLQVINHGFVKTRLTAKNDFDMPQLMLPEEAALQIFEGLKRPYRFEVRFPYGLSLFLRILRTLPYKLSLALTKKALK